MKDETDDRWWTAKPRNIVILNDTVGWATPWCNVLCSQIQSDGDKCRVVHDVSELNSGDIAFLIGCTKIMQREHLGLNRHNLVVHASALPNGRGFSPLKWQICEGTNVIPLTLFEAVEGCDQGPIYLATEVTFGGHELLDEMQNEIGKTSNDLCMRWLRSPRKPAGVPQLGKATLYGRRNEQHQRLKVDSTIREQFNILRTVDNDRFPAFFELNGYRYELKIRKISKQ